MLLKHKLGDIFLFIPPIEPFIDIGEIVSIEKDSTLPYTLYWEKVAFHTAEDDKSLSSSEYIKVDDKKYAKFLYAKN